MHQPYPSFRAQKKIQRHSNKRNHTQHRRDDSAQLTPVEVGRPPVPLRRRIEEAASSTKKWPNFRKLAGLEISEKWGEREKEGGEEGVYINVGDHPPLFGYLGF